MQDHPLWCKMKKSLEIFSVIGLLTIAAFFDVVYQGAKQFDPTSIQSNNLSLFWLRITSTIFITIMLLIISRYLLWHPPHDLVVSIVCIILGAIIILSATVSGTHFIAQFDLPRSVLRVWLNDIVSSGLSLTSHVAAFVFCIGIFRLSPFLSK